MESAFIREQDREDNKQQGETEGDGMEATSLCDAAQHGDMETVKALLESGADVDAYDARGRTPLMLAAGFGWEDVSTVLLARGAHVDKPSPRGETPLHLASIEGHLVVVRVLLRNGAQVDKADESGVTPLIAMCTKCPNLDVANELLAHNAQVDVASAVGETALLVASQNGHVDAVRALLHHGTDVNKATHKGNTPLFVASQRGHLAAVQLLLESGARADVPCVGEATALFIAAMNGHHAVVEELLRHGAGTDNIAEGGITALYAASHNGHLDVVKALVESGASVDRAGIVEETPLYVACEKGHLEVVNTLIRGGAQVNKTTMEGPTPLILAAQNGHLEVVETLLKSGALVNVLAKNGGSALRFAVGMGHLSVVKELLKNGAVVDVVDAHQTTPLFFACQQGHSDVAMELLKNGAQVNQVNANGAGPLHIASHSGYVDIVKKLIDAGAEVDQVDASGMSPLYIASQSGHLDVVEALLMSGCHVDLKNARGITPLHIASERGHTSVVSELIHYGAQVDTEDVEGGTPLYSSSQEGHLEVVDALLRNGAQVNKPALHGMSPLFAITKPDRVSIINTLVEFSADVNMVVVDGKTPLHVVVLNGGHLEVVKALLKNDAQVDRADGTGSTPLLLASQQGRVDIMHELVRQEAQVNWSNFSGATSLHLASSEGHLDAVQMLLDCGADIDQMDGYGWTPLHIASRQGRTDVVTELLNRGAQVDRVDATGATPLLAACCQGHSSIVAALLESGANLTLPDLNGHTPLSIACFGGHSDVVEKLLHKGASVDSSDRGGNTPLIGASQQGHLSIVQLLIGAGASLDTTNSFGETALTAAGRAGEFDVLRALADAGASVHVRPAHGETCLISAARFGRLDVTDLLIQRGCLDQRSRHLMSDVPLLHGTLQTLYEYSSHTHEFASLWDSVVQRLINVHAQAESDEESFAKIIRQFVAIIFRLMKLKVMCETNNVFVRVIVSRSVANNIRDFHTEIDELQKNVKSSAIKSIHSAKWEYNQAAMIQVFRVALRETYQVTLSLKEEIDQVESISLLQNELHTRRDQHSEEMLGLLRDSLKIALRFSKGLAVPALPEWFISHYELDIDRSRTLDTQSGSSMRPIHARWQSSDVIASEIDMLQEDFEEIATRWFKLRHPNVVELFRATQLRRPFVAVFEKAKATNLREYLSMVQHRDQVWQKLFEVALGLKFLHRRGIILGTFQCGHFWVDTHGVAKINGFGIEVFNLQPANDPDRVRWQSPECLRGKKPSIQSDIYSFGMCVLEAMSQQIPWSNDTAREVASKLARDSRPPRPQNMTDSQWQLMKNMCWANPEQRTNMSRVIESLSQFADVERGNSLRVVEVASSKVGTSHLDVYKFVFPELGSSLKQYLERLRNNITLCRDLVEEIYHVFSRLESIYEWLRSVNKLPSDPGVGKYCAVLLTFHRFLRISAVSDKSVHERTRSQKVSSRNNVLHRELDSVLETLEMPTIDPIHHWRHNIQVDGEKQTEVSESHHSPDSEPKRTDEKDSPALEIIRFDTESGAQVPLPLDVLQKPWHIPLHEIKLNRDESIGTGSFGEVFLGTWLSTPVVVKFMGYEDDTSRYPQELFLHELRVWLPLKHPNVARLYGAFDVDKRYFVCEHVANGTLRDYLKQDRNRDKKWQKLHEVALGLRYLHQNNIVHNDLKGDNFLIDADDKVKIIDFGLSSILNSAEVKFNQKKLGALQWRSPECLRGGERLTLASDIYSFGMCIVEVFTGAFPWGRAIDIAVRFQVLRKKALPRKPDAMDENQWSLVRTMCAFDPLVRIDISTTVDRLYEFAQQEKKAADAKAFKLQEALESPSTIAADIFGTAINGYRMLTRMGFSFSDFTLAGYKDICEPIADTMDTVFDRCNELGYNVTRDSLRVVGDVDSTTMKLVPDTLS